MNLTLSTKIKENSLFLVPLFIFSFFSWLTTATGLQFSVAFGSEIEKWAIALPLSLAIQSFMIAATYYINKNGLRTSYLAIYCLTALFSIFFSYAGMYRIMNEKDIPRERLELIQDDYRRYLREWQRRLTASTGVVGNAMVEAQKLIDKERVSGGTQSSPRVSSYLKYVERDLKVDPTTVERRGGTGPIYNRLLVEQEILSRTNDRVSGCLNSIDSVASLDFDSEEDLAASARQLGSVLNWMEVCQILKTVTVEDTVLLSEPVFYIAKPEISSGESDDRVFRQWLGKAIHDLEHNLNSIRVILPLGLAVLFDGVILLLALVFPQSSRWDTDPIKIQMVVRNSIAESSSQGPGLPILCKALLRCLYTKGGKTYCNLARVKDEGSYLRELASVLESKSYLKPTLWGDRFRAPNTLEMALHNLLNES